MANLAVFEIDRRIKETVVGAFFHQAGDERQLAAELSQCLHLRGFRRQRDARNGVPEKITGQAQLREKH